MKVNVEELTFNESYQQDKMFIGNPKRVKSSIKWAGLARMRERTTASIMEKKRKTVNVDYSNAVYEARIDSYRDFLFKLNYTYGVFVDMEKLEDLNTTGVLKV